MDEATRRNIMALKEFMENNRKMIQTLEGAVENLKHQIVEQNKLIQNQHQQISNLQQKLYSGSSSR